MPLSPQTNTDAAPRCFLDEPPIDPADGGRPGRGQRRKASPLEEETPENSSMALKKRALVDETSKPVPKRVARKGAEKKVVTAAAAEPEEDLGPLVKLTQFLTGSTSAAGEVCRCRLNAGVPLPPPTSSSRGHLASPTGAGCPSEAT